VRAVRKLLLIGACFLVPVATYQCWRSWVDQNEARQRQTFDQRDDEIVELHDRIGAGGDARAYLASIKPSASAPSD
jgi:hypothetical protein